jgi:hypothetical protein
MKITNHRLVRCCIALPLPLLACAVSSYGQSAPPVAEAASETVQLPQFTVTSTPADPYRPADALSVNRVAGSLLDSPFTVNVVTEQLIADLGANAAFDVTQYFPGISAGRGSGAGGIDDRQDFRGFEDFTKTIDNFSSFLLPTGSGFQGTFDPEFVERRTRSCRRPEPRAVPSTSSPSRPNSSRAPTSRPRSAPSMRKNSPSIRPGPLGTAGTGPTG